MELRDLLLQLHVNVLGAADDPTGGDPESVRIYRIFGCSKHSRIVGETQVVVGGTVKDCLSVQSDFGLLRRGDDPFDLSFPSVLHLFYGSGANC